MKIHAVLIGVDVYHDASITNLLCATSDAHAFKHRLEQLGAVVRLIPAAQLSGDAIFDAIERARAALTDAGEDSLFIFYFAGHGKTWRSGTFSDHLLLLPTARARTLNRPNLTGIPGILSWQTLMAQLADFPGHCLAILDACRSPLTVEGTRDGDSASQFEGAEVLTRDFAAHFPTSGRIAPCTVINSCGNNQKAREVPGVGGFFTASLNALIDKAKSTGRGELRLEPETFEQRLQPELDHLCQQHNVPLQERQTPIISGPALVIPLREESADTNTGTAESDKEAIAREARLWKIACLKKTVEGYESYLRETVLATHEKEALGRIEKLLDAAKQAKEKQIHAAAAEAAAWREADAADTPEAWASFVRDYPESEKCAEAVQRQQVAQKRVDAANTAQVDPPMATPPPAAPPPIAPSPARPQAPVSSRSKLPWLVAGAAGLILVVVLGKGWLSGGPTPDSSPSAASPTPASASAPAPVPKPAPVPARKAFEPEMVTIPAGRFQMGSSTSEEGHEDDELPVHTVHVPSFQMGKYAITRGEFRAFVDATGYKTDAEKNSGGSGCYVYEGGSWGWKSGASWRDPVFPQGDSHPVVCVSWNDAQAYVGWLNKETAGGYRLPSESEWEYAARAGTTGPFSFSGVIISPAKVNYDSNYTYGGSRKDASGYREKTVEVGSLPANPWGLHEVHGNVWEWVEDCWHGSYNNAPDNGSAWTSGCDGDRRVLRGGSWNSSPRYTRSAYRNLSSPGYRGSLRGFRVARMLPGA